MTLRSRQHFPNDPYPRGRGIGLSTTSIEIEFEIAMQDSYHNYTTGVGMIYAIAKNVPDAFQFFGIVLAIIQDLCYRVSVDRKIM